MRSKVRGQWDRVWRYVVEAAEIVAWLADELPQYFQQGVTAPLPGRPVWTITEGPAVVVVEVVAEPQPIVVATGGCAVGVPMTPELLWSVNAENLNVFVGRILALPDEQRQRATIADQDAPSYRPGLQNCIDRIATIMRHSYEIGERTRERHGGMPVTSSDALMLLEV
jgi:hypothetical protein